MSETAQTVRNCALMALLSGVFLTAPVLAQTAASEPKESPLAEVVVTGTLLTQDGYQAPTPVTVAPTEELLKGAPISIAQGLTQLPQFLGSAGPNQGANTAGPGSGASANGTVLNLRGLGADRDLILLDGVRAPITNYTGTVNIDLLPQLLVKRVDVVTAGASASYGSDAVSGVANFVLDKDFNGVKGVAQGGVTTFGDNGNERAGLAWGTKIGARAHLLLDAEISNVGGYHLEDRPELNTFGGIVGSVVGGGRAGTAGNPLIYVPNLRNGLTTPGGEALSGPFAGTCFISTGVYRPCVAGTPTATPNVFVAPSDFVTNMGFPLSAGAAARVRNGFAQLNYDLSDNVTAYVRAMASDQRIQLYTQSNIIFPVFLPTTTIFSGNPFIPAPLQAQLTGTSTPSFQFTKWLQDLGPTDQHQTNDFSSGAAGLAGRIGRFDWKVDYVYGSATANTVYSNNPASTLLAAALDAVVDPATGAIVCGPSLSSNPAVAARYAGCVPYNPFGAGATSAAAHAYVTAAPARSRSVIDTNFVTATMSGDLLSLPAGALAGALGVDYRDETLSLTTNANPAIPLDVTGLRGIAASALPYGTGSTTPAAGADNFKEVFGELAVPLLKDLPAVQRLSLNASGRLSDYSTSGNHTTWKGGLTWQPIDDLQIRLTRSHDLRAPTLYEQFAGNQIGVGGGVDPHTGGNAAFQTVTGSNPNLEPEVGNTFSVGFTYQPSYVPGLGFSVDYYNVKITDAIATLTPAAILQACEASNGTGPSCAEIVRPLPFSNHTVANGATQIIVEPINLAVLEVRGVDFDATYRHAVGPGNLSLRLYAGYVANFSTQLSSTASLINYAGYVAAGSGGVSGGIPRLKAVGDVNYDIGPFTAFVRESLVGPLNYGPASVAIYAQPHIPSWPTTAVTLIYRLPGLTGGQLFGTVTNVFNRTPPIVGATNDTGGLETISGLYDSTGRAYTAGVRFRF